MREDHGVVEGLWLLPELLGLLCGVSAGMVDHFPPAAGVCAYAVVDLS